MPDAMMSFLAELRRRKVWRVAGVYATTALATALAVAELYDDIGLPDGTPRFVIVLLVIGFPISLILAWAYDIRPEAEVDAARGPEAADPLEPDTAPATEAPDPNALVVLPFANLSPDPDNEYFADGMTEEIINAVANVPGLRVIARTSAFSFKGSNRDVRDIGQELGVGTILEGSVRKVGARLRITAQLIDVAGGHHLWSERYDRELEDVFAIQDEIAQIIARRLKPGSEEPEIRGRPTENLEAYEALLRGHFSYAKATVDDYVRSVAHYERAATLDPNLVEAHTGMANAWSYAAVISDAEGRFPKARAAALHALELDSRAADAHATLGFIQCFYEWDWRGSLASFERAIELNPGSVMAHHDYSTVLGNLGMAEEAVGHARQCVSLDPLSPQANHILAFSLWAARDYEGALEYDRRALELAPDFVYARLVRGFALMDSGRIGEAEEEFREFLDRWPAEPLVRGALGAACARRGNADEARLQLMRLLNRPGDPDGATRQSLATVYTALGETDEALRWIERGLEARDSFIVGLRYYNLWDPLRPDPRFQDIVEGLGYPELSGPSTTRV